MTVYNINKLDYKLKKSIEKYFGSKKVDLLYYDLVNQFYVKIKNPFDMAEVSELKKRTANKLLRNTFKDFPITLLCNCPKISN